MIILAKYQRSSRIRKQAVKVYRTSRLFDPVYWIGRDHCWIPSPWSDWYIRWNWYIIIWSMERYIDARGYEKTSIIPKYKLWLFRHHKKKVFGKNIHEWYSLWRWSVYKPIKKRYNVNIKSKLVQMHLLKKFYHLWR
jgi:hypothetical protein